MLDVGFASTQPTGFLEKSPLVKKCSCKSRDFVTNDCGFFYEKKVEYRLFFCMQTLLNGTLHGY